MADFPAMILTILRRSLVILAPVLGSRFGDWTQDRKSGDPRGKWLQSRKDARRRGV